MKCMGRIFITFMWVVFPFFAIGQSPSETEVEITPPQTLLDKLDVGVAPPRQSARTTALGFKWSLIKLNQFKPRPQNSFSDIYKKSGPYVEFALEQFLAQKNWGAVTVGGTTGVFYVDGATQIDRVTMVGLPLLASLSYRGELVNRQLFIPYVRTSAGGWYYRQRSTDKSYNKSGVRPVVAATLGGDLLLDFFLWDYSLWMDTNLGVNWTTITGEVQYFQGLDQSSEDFSHWQINFGIRFEL